MASRYGNHARSFCVGFARGRSTARKFGLLVILLIVEEPPTHKEGFTLVPATETPSFQKGEPCPIYGKDHALK